MLCPMKMTDASSVRNQVTYHVIVQTYIALNADKIPPFVTPAYCHRKNPTLDIALDHLLDTNTRTDTDIADQGHSHILTDIEVTVTITPIEAVPDLIIDTTIGVFHATISPALTVIVVTYHTTNLPQIGALQHIQEITADPNPALHMSQVRKLSINPNIMELQQNLKIRGIPESQ